MGRTAVVLLLTMAFAPAAARAQNEGNDESARVHFNSGRAYFEEGNYERALDEFQEAYARSPRSMMLFNIGTTQERLGMLREAADTFERFLNEVPDAENRDLLRRRIENLRRRAERVASGQADTGDDEATDTSTTPTPGPRSTPPASGGGDGLVLGGAIALGVAGAALIGAVITGALALGAQSSVQNGCYATRSCTPADVSDMDTLALTTDILWPVAAAAGVAGAVLIILGATSSSESAPSAWLAPFVSPTAAGLSAGGRL